MIAAIHAGWKGAFKGIINKVIKFMIKKGCKIKKYDCCYRSFYFSKKL